MCNTLSLGMQANERLAHRDTELHDQGRGRCEVGGRSICDDGCVIAKGERLRGIEGAWQRCSQGVGIQLRVDQGVVADHLPCVCVGDDLKCGPCKQHMHQLCIDMHVVAGQCP
jgi:hypothetical protein